MMFHNKLVACIKTGGKVLREHGNVVYVPFSSEFSILLKNLNSVGVSVKISIDGTDVLNGDSLIIRANESMELERYLKDLDKGNRFKFIERSDAVEQHRGVGAEDGLIRIEYQFERAPLFYQTRDWFSRQTSTSTVCSSPLYDPFTRYKSLDNTPQMMASPFTTSTYSVQSMVNNNPVQSDVGITVPGSLSEQKFQTVAALNLEPETHVIVIQLKGETETKQVVTKPVTVAVKPKCVTCGRVNKAGSKFCTQCGTSLSIV